MKKTLLILVACSTMLIANAQYQSIFGQNSTSWAYWSEGVARDPDIIYTLYSDNSDTLINSKFYKKVFTSQGMVHNFLREDTITGSVYSLHLGLNEVEIMNMNLSVGDSFCLAPLLGCKRVVDSVYTDTLGRKVIQFDEAIHNHSTWKFIEGIGPNAQFRLKDGDAEPVEDLVCSHKDNIRVFINDYGETCPTFFVGLNEHSIQLIKIYPNPAREFIHMELENPKSTRFKIFNLNGAVVYIGQFKSKTTINIQHLPQGIYIIEFANNGNTFYQKLVTQ